MTRRQSISPDDSLELLLDTICNTFGAVIFISMLASVLVQNSAQSSAASAQIAAAEDELRVQQSMLPDLERRRTVLATQLAAQQELIDRFSSRESLAMAQQIHDDSEARQRIASQKSDAVERQMTAEQARLKLERQVAEQLEQLAQARKQQTTAAELVEALTETIGQTAEIRKVHESSKFGIVFALDDGRLYAVHRAEFGGGIEGLTINRDDCEVAESARGTSIKPLPAAGLLIRGNPNAEAEAKSKLQAVSSRFIVKLFIARDSFGEFLPVKRALRSLKLEYAIDIMDGDSVELGLTDDTQQKSFVQ